MTLQAQPWQTDIGDARKHIANMQPSEDHCRIPRGTTHSYLTLLRPVPSRVLAPSQCLLCSACSSRPLDPFRALLVWPTCHKDPRKSKRGISVRVTAAIQVSDVQAMCPSTGGLWSGSHSGHSPNCYNSAAWLPGGFITRAGFPHWLLGTTGTSLPLANASGGGRWQRPSMQATKQRHPKNRLHFTWQRQLQRTRTNLRILRTQVGVVLFDFYFCFTSWFFFFISAASASCIPPEMKLQSSWMISGKKYEICRLQWKKTSGRI